MKEPLFRSERTRAMVLAVAMWGVLGLMLGAAYALTLEPPSPHASRRASPFRRSPLHPIMPYVPTTQPDAYDPDEP